MKPKKQQFIRFGHGCWENAFSERRKNSSRLFLYFLKILLGPLRKAFRIEERLTCGKHRLRRPESGNPSYKPMTGRPCSKDHSRGLA